MEELAEGLGGNNGHATWTSAQSTFMLTNLANVVASGTKTSKGFKKVHLNACARALNEKFATKRTGEQIKNHLKTWSRKFAKINRLRKLSAAGWDEDNFVITLDADHYNSHVEVHKADAEYLNKPLEHFAEMQIIFGNSMATGNFAKDSSAPLGAEDVETDTEEDAAQGPADGINTPNNDAASSSASRPKKKAKIAENEDDGLIKAFKSVGTDLAEAIKTAGKPDTDLPSDLFDQLKSLPGFEKTHVSFYFSYLVANPHIGRAFYALPFEHKIDWFALFITERFPGQ
ncbi:hypothetical protein BS78_02G227500 [Paspalum vaginatum]|nr:hypothetical protein BS78_09G082100 [Paspalum vaginatum]KAJ1262857.1 hypothetical protein BS78_09G140900 [Paspalum vaginatum]KAJ1274978.1 hypothetical protein BS78_05G101000 [Paspalum vaginatum]KAJ1290235.1 hypothetical protein BS78_02G227500 [Paspalum vaginatum]